MKRVARKSTRAEVPPHPQTLNLRPSELMRKPPHRFNPARPDCTPVSPMRPEIIRDYEQLQRQLESEGKWDDANILNA